MKIKVYVSTNEEVASDLTPEEIELLDKYREVTADMDIHPELLSTELMGWYGAASKGALAIKGRLDLRVNRDFAPSLMPVIVPWVPPGETWSPWDEHNDQHHTSWKIIIRRFAKR